MMTAVDTPVLIAICQGEADGRRWAERLAECRAEGGLCVCEVVAAELFALLMDEGEHRVVLEGLGVEYVPSTLAAAQQAGRAFRLYRNAGGPRTHLVPDFLIAAHAQVQADRLASLDRGYLRRYFSGLRLVTVTRMET